MPIRVIFLSVSNRYFEDFKPGDMFVSSDIHLTEPQIVEFATQFDPQPFHTDPTAAQHSFFNGLAASGWHTAALTMRLLVQSPLRIAGGLIGAGVEEIRWPRPVRPGDILHVEIQVLKCRTSSSRPTLGLVHFEVATRNQKNEIVQSMVAKLVIPRREVPH